MRCVWVCLSFSTHTRRFKIRNMANLELIAGDGGTECLEKLARWIISGTLVEAFRQNPEEVWGCVVRGLGVLLLAAGGWIQQDQPVFKIAPDGVQPGTEAIQLADALGVVPPSSGPVSNAIFVMLIKALLAYLEQKLPDLINVIEDLVEDPS